MFVAFFVFFMTGLNNTGLLGVPIKVIKQSFLCATKAPTSETHFKACGVTVGFVYVNCYVVLCH